MHRFCNSRSGLKLNRVSKLQATLVYHSETSSQNSQTLNFITCNRPRKDFLLYYYNSTKFLLLSCFLNLLWGYTISHSFILFRIGFTSQSSLKIHKIYNYLAKINQKTSPNLSKILKRDLKSFLYVNKIINTIPRIFSQQENILCQTSRRGGI